MPSVPSCECHPGTGVGDECGRTEDTVPFWFKGEGETAVGKVGTGNPGQKGVAERQPSEECKAAGAEGAFGGREERHGKGAQNRAPEGPDSRLRAVQGASWPLGESHGEVGSRHLQESPLGLQLCKGHSRSLREQ